MMTCVNLICNLKVRTSRAPVFVEAMDHLWLYAILEKDALVFLLRDEKTVA